MAALVSHTCLAAGSGDAAAISVSVGNFQVRGCKLCVKLTVFKSKSAPLLRFLKLPPHQPTDVGSAVTPSGVHDDRDRPVTPPAEAGNGLLLCLMGNSPGA